MKPQPLATISVSVLATIAVRLTMPDPVGLGLAMLVFGYVATLAYLQR